MHYTDKRGIRTLDHQLHQFHQKGSRVDEFYARVNHQFSLIINKIKTESYTVETIKAPVETYRKRALDVFVRGLNGDMSWMPLIQRPRTLLGAYSACLENQNVDLRNSSIHPSTVSNCVTVPINNLPSTSYFQNRNKHPKLPARPTWPAQDHRPQYSKNDSPSVELKTRTLSRVRRLREWRLTLLSKQAIQTILSDPTPSNAVRNLKTSHGSSKECFTQCQRKAKNRILFRSR